MDTATQVKYGIVALILVVFGVWWSTVHKVPTPLPISEEDTIASWTFDGPLKDGGEREEKVLSHIKELKQALGGADDYQLYASIALEYEHLGEGKRAYEYYSRAIAEDTEETTGLAWHNMGILMEKLGAYHTARIAHEKAVQIQPNIASSHLSRIELMIYHFADDTEGVEEAFKDAEASLGSNGAMFIDLRNRWENILTQ